MTEQERIRLCKDFTLLTGGHWHDYKFGTKNGNSYLKCSCGHLAYLGQFTKLNPTYTNPADVLKVMKENGRYDEFIISTFCDHSFNQNTFFVKMFLDNFIIEPDALLKAAVKFLEEKL